MKPPPVSTLTRADGSAKGTDANRHGPQIALRAASVTTLTSTSRRPAAPASDGKEIVDDACAKKAVAELTRD